MAAFTKERISSVKAPKEVFVWPGLKRSEFGKVLKTDVKQTLSSASQA